MNQEVRSTLEQLKHKLYPSTQPTEKQMERKQSITPAVPNILTAELFERMSVSKAAKHCLSLNIDKPSAIHKLTGKPIEQIYTALWSIRNKGKKAKAVVAKQEVKQTTVVTQAEAFVMSNEAKTNKLAAKEAKDYITFLENRMSEWQAEARKQAHEINHLKAALAKSHETRNVTSEVTEVMEEVMKLRATVAYLESKLFGGK